MKKLLTLLLCGTLSCTPKLIEPNTNMKTFQDTSQTGIEKFIEVNRNDLQMYMQINPPKINDTLSYLSILQTYDDTITIDNHNNKSIKYSVFKDNKLYGERIDNTNAIISLFDNGYIKQETQGDSIKGTIANARIWAVMNNDTICTILPSPITASWKEKRIGIENEIVKEKGTYNIDVDIDYSIRDTLYHVTFTSQPFSVGGTTGINKLIKMSKK